VPGPGEGAFLPRPIRFERKSTFAQILAILATLAALQTKSLFFRGLIKMANLASLATLATLKLRINRYRKNEAPQPTAAIRRLIYCF
jgi:hypothetical protein